MIGSLDENGRKTDLLMASDVKCTRREPNNTHLVSVIDLANILKFGHESSSFHWIFNFYTYVSLVIQKGLF